MISKLFAFLAAVLTGAASAPTPQSLAHVVLRAPKAVLTVQIARTGAQRELGLMGVRRLAPHTGMLFIFESDGPVAFWMKDTLIPLDMVFVSPDGTVRQIFTNVPVVAPSLPDDKIPLEQGRANYVVELPANEAARDGIRPGCRLRGIPGARTSRS